VYEAHCVHSMSFLWTMTDTARLLVYEVMLLKLLLLEAMTDTASLLVYEALRY
jgi:hypothetical protein